MKRFGPNGPNVVSDLSIHVRRGEVVGILGPNGAGKSTTISMLIGIIEATSGTIEIDGLDLERKRAAALRRVNFAGSYLQLPGNLTVLQNLRVFGMMYGVSNLREVVGSRIAELGLEGLQDRKTGLLSTGEQARVGLAKALLNDPALLLLDEPTGALDPASARDIRSIIRGFVVRRGCGVLWTSHNMLEVEEVCDRVLMLSRGKVVLEGNPRSLPAAHGHTSLEELFVSVAREPLAVR